MDHATNTNLATALRRASHLHESSWNGERYTISHSGAAEHVCPGDPLAIIIACLLTAGFCDTWDFCDQVLGAPAGDAATTTE